MAYLGAQPNKTLTKTTSQSFNGTGSATTFTLNRAVNTEEELEVFVENVQQEPGSGKSYTASGTTLTFDEAPPSGTGNIYVIYRGQAEVTTRLEHDANAALSATTGTFSGAVTLSGGVSGDVAFDTDTLVVDAANNKVGIRTSPDRDLHVKGAAGDPVHFKLEGDAADYARIMFDDGTTDNVGEIRYHFGSDYLRFNTNGSERMRIDSSGNVGVGVTTATELNESGFRELVIGGATEGAGFTLKDADANVKLGMFTSDSSGSGVLRTITNHPLIFRTNNTDRVRIDTNGNLGVGVTSMAGSNRLYSSGSYSATTGSGANLVIQSNGLLERSVSSQRYKNTINDATHGLTELMTLRPVTYKHNNNGDTVFGGLIAEEVHTAGLTEFVVYSEDDNGDDQPEALHYGNMVSLCIKAIQELKTELDAEKVKTATLETKVAALEGN
jgi:hypothetical protein